jgi:hypothetical protein
MKRIILILSVFLFSCAQEIPIKPEYGTTVIFWASGTSHWIEKPNFGQFEVKSKISAIPPDCQQLDNPPFHYVFHNEQPGTYYIQLKHYNGEWKEYSYTLKHNECKRLNVSQVHGWD